MSLHESNSFIITTLDMIRILKVKYNQEINSFGSDTNQNISIFVDHINFFEGFIQLDEFIQDKLNSIEHDAAVNILADYQIRYLFESLGVDQLVFDNNSHVSFSPFHTAKTILENEGGGFFPRNLLVDINNRINWTKGMTERCRKFLNIYSQVTQNRTTVFREEQIKSDLFSSFHEVYGLLSTYGELLCGCLCFQLKKDDVNDEGFGQCERIIGLITSEIDLIWARFKYEDDGKRGVNLVCTLIYPFEAKLKFSSIVLELKNLPEKNNLNKISNVYDAGDGLQTFAGMKVTGKVDTIEKLKNFFYWVVSPLYRHEEFFNYPDHDNPKQIQKFQRSWDQKFSIETKYNKKFNLTFEKLGNYSRSEKNVWSINPLDKTIQSKLIQAKSFYSELPSNNNINVGLDTDIFYYLEVFIEFLKVSQESFFLLNPSIFYTGKVRLSRIGNQLIFIFRHMIKDTKAFRKINYINSLLGGRWDDLVRSEIWKTLERLHKEGSLSILNYQIFDLLNYQYRKSIFKEDIRFRPKLSDLVIKDINLLHTIDEFTFFENRTIDTQKYVKKLLREDKFICRFQFSMKIDESSFLSNKRFFSECFTEFRRIYERKALLKNLSGYFIIWLKDKDDKPIADVVWIIDSTPDFEYSKFSMSLQDAWSEFLTSFFSLEKNLNSKKQFCAMPKLLMHSVDLLNKSYVLVESTDKILIKIILNQLIPYFTYRHFFSPKLYHDPNMSTKLFTKGRISQPKTIRKGQLP